MDRPQAPSIDFHDLRQVADTGYAYALSWAERYGLVVTRFRRFRGDVEMRFGPRERALLATSEEPDPKRLFEPGDRILWLEQVRRSHEVRAGVLYADFRRIWPTQAHSALPLLRVLCQGGDHEDDEDDPGDVDGDPDDRLRERAGDRDDGGARGRGPHHGRHDDGRLRVRR